MVVHIVCREYSNWEEEKVNGTDIINVFDTNQKAEQQVKQIYEKELMLLNEEGYKIVNIDKKEYYAEISTIYGDIDIYIISKEVK